MSKKVINGTIAALVDQPQQKSIVVETEAAKPAEGKKPPQPAKRVQIATNDHSILEGLERGKTVKITIEQ